MKRTPPARRAAFTLIELVVVLLILAAIAGLVIPQVGMLGRTTDMAVSAKTQADLASNIQLFFVLQKRYPNQLDSLLDTTQAGYAPVTPFPSGDAQTFGLPVSGADGAWMGFTDNGTTLAQLTTAQLTSGQARSITRSGIAGIYDHATTGNANNSANTLRAVASGEEVAVVQTGRALETKLVPNIANETGFILVAFGIGPRNSAISKTLTNCPTYPGCDGKYYGRYIAVFKVYESGERATLAGVVDAYGRTPDYTQLQFNESLPDGGRQG